MTRVRNFFVKESEFSSAIFPIGVIGLTLVLGIMLKKYILGYYFWLDEIHNGTLFFYTYIIVGSLNAWFVSDRCRNKSLLRMLTAGLTPIAVVMSLRWFFSGFVTARLLMLFMIICSAYIVFQIVTNFLQKKKFRIISIGINKWLSVLTMVSMIGMSGYCLTGMDLVDIQTVGSIVASDDGRSWDSNRDTLRLWKENIYTDLSDQEKKSLFQDTIILECLYWGIDPVILEVETYKSETLMGYYSDQYYTISIREEMFDMPREEVLDTLLHETHHAYVHKAVQSVDWNDKNIEENKELRLYKDLQLYKQGIDNYIPADVDPDSYYNNPIEVAAREYAEEWGPKYLQYADSI